MPEQKFKCSYVCKQSFVALVLQLHKSLLTPVFASVSCGDGPKRSENPKMFNISAVSLTFFSPKPTKFNISPVRIIFDSHRGNVKLCGCGLGIGMCESTRYVLILIFVTKKRPQTVVPGLFSQNLAVAAVFEHF